MNEKRYSIVRVDESCPFVVEDIKHKDCEKIFNCDEFWEDTPCSKKCNYGDTKEQLIVKVQQALFKSVFTEEVQKVVVIEEQERIYKQYRPMAEKVVEFLGVEE